MFGADGRAPCEGRSGRSPSALFQGVDTNIAIALPAMAITNGEARSFDPHRQKQAGACAQFLIV